MGTRRNRKTGNKFQDVPAIGVSIFQVYVRIEKIYCHYFRTTLFTTCDAYAEGGSADVSALHSCFVLHAVQNINN